MELCGREVILRSPYATYALYQEGELGLSSVRIQSVYDAIMRLTTTFNEKNQ